MHRARAASTPGDQPYRRSLAIIPQLAPHHEPGAAAIRTGDRKRAAGRPPRIFLIFGNGPKLEENHRPIHSPRYPFGFRTKGCVMDGSNSALSSYLTTAELFKCNSNSVLTLSDDINSSL